MQSQPISRDHTVALKTFLNLPAERQQEIIRACLEEFILHDYESASLSDIVKRLGLAKGSFYRYFESKRDLYYYLLDHCIQERMANDEQMIPAPAHDFFELILQHFRAKVHFDRHHALESAFLYQVLHEKNSEELGNLHHIRKQKALTILLQLIDGFRDKGQLRTDLEREVMAWNILQTQLSIFEFIEIRFQQDFRANIRDRKLLYDLPEEEIMAVAAQFIDIQRRGLSPAYHPPS